MASEPIFRGHEESLPTGAPGYTPKPHKPLARPLRYLLEEQRLLFALVGMAVTSAVLLTAPSSSNGGGAVAAASGAAAAGGSGSLARRQYYGGSANAALGAAVGEQERRASAARLPLGVRRRGLRVVVTGGAGFVGSHLVDRLLERGDSVVVVDNFFTGRKENLAHQAGNPALEVIRHDVVEPILLEVDRIYHLACPASPVHYKHNPVKTIKTNVMGTLNMLGLAKRVGARFLLTSTSEVYGDPLQHPQVETYWGNVNPIGTCIRRRSRLIDGSCTFDLASFVQHVRRRCMHVRRSIYGLYLHAGVRSCYDEGKRTAETLTMDYHRAANLEVGRRPDSCTAACVAMHPFFADRMAIACIFRPI
jgi:UDP-glucuronate decarboxylase